MTKARILIVEDEPILAKDLEIRLQNIGYEIVASVRTGKEAIEVVNTHKPDLVLMDIVIEGNMDGIEAATAIYAHADVPIIYLTSCADDETFERANTSAVPYAYLLKPIQERELDLCIRTSIQKHQLEKKLANSEIRYRSLFESTKEAIIIFDDKGRVLETNQATEAIYNDLMPNMGEFLREYFPNETRNNFDLQFERFLQDGELQGRFWLRSDNGLLQKCIEFNAKARFLPSMHLVVLRDVSESAIARREIENLAKFPSEAPNPVLRVSTEGKVMYANKASAALLDEWKTRYGDFIPDNLMGRISELSATQPQTQIMIVVGGKIFSLLFVYVKKGNYINIYANDISQQKYSERTVNFQKDILELIARNEPLVSILEQICMRVQHFLAGSTASIFLYDPLSKNIRLGASTRLPQDFVSLIENCITSTDEVEPCMIAIAEQADILIENIEADTLTTRYKSLAQKYQYKGAWLKPVVAQEGSVVACFTMFYKETISPSIVESNLVNIAASLVGVAIERDLIFQSMHKQALAFENINDAIFLVDNGGVITEWSPSAERLFGYRKEDMLGHKLADMNIVAFTEGLVNFWSQSEIMRWSGELDYQTRHLEGGILELSVIRLSNNPDDYIGSLCVARDITQKIKVAMALRLSETNLKAIFDNTVQSFILLNGKFEIIAFNRTAKQISYAVTGNFLQLGDPITNYWYTDEKIMLQSIMERTLSGEYISYEEYITTRLGESYWLEINFLPIYDADKNITSICFTTLNIQDRKNTALALSESEARFRSLVQNSSDVVMVTEGDGKITYVSESAHRLLGYQTTDIVGKNLLDFVHPDDISYVDVLLQNLSDRLMSVPPTEYKFLHVRGHYVYLESLCTNLLDEPAVCGIVHNSRNVDERKNSEETLKNIVRGVSDATGKDFFKSLAQNLATYLDVSHVVIAEIETMNESLRTLAYSRNGKDCENFSYPITNTPYEVTLEQRMYYVEEHISFLYPDNKWLINEGIDTYLGVRLNDSRGLAIGLVCVMDSKPLSNHDLAGSMLRIFSVRASAELERIYTTEALIESQANLVSLIENTIDNIWAIDSNYRITALNSSFRKSVEREWGHIINTGDSALSIGTLEMMEEWKAFYDRAFAGEQFSREVETEINGIVQNTEVFFNPIVDENNEISGVSIFSRDITERKKAEIALRESEVNLVALIENTDDIIYSINANYEVLAANSAFRRLHNLMFSRIIKPGTSILQNLPPQYAEVWKKGFDKALKGERVRQEIHYDHPKFPVDLEVSFNPIYTRGGGISGISVFARDITLRKQAENELKRTNFELDSFVYRASHDLRAPLRSVLGLTNLLRIEQSAEQRNTYLNLTEKSINKLDNFISDLTHFSRNTRLSLNIEKIDFNAIIQDCLDNLRYMEHAEKIDSSLSIEQSVDFYSDASRIAIILQNLVSNAIKYQRREAGALVSIDIKTSDFSAMIIVDDNGRGIDGQYLDKIFDMFFRASEDSYGSGLGLYITKQVVEKLEGNIAVESEVNIGTTFIIKIPNLKSQAKIQK